jgi:ribosomal protein L23
LDFEKYMNPKGLKPTITSNFKKPPVEIEFVSHEVQLLRSPKPYEKDEIGFRHSPFLSKPELKQYLMKLYNLPVERVNNFNKIGKIMRNSEKGGHWRKQDWKKSFVKVGFEVDPDLQKIM